MWYLTHPQVGAPVAHGILSEVLQTIVDDQRETEIDPNKLEEGADVSSGVQALQELSAVLLEQALANLHHSVSRCFQLSYLLNLIWIAVSTHFPNTNQKGSKGASVLFLRSAPIRIVG